MNARNRFFPPLAAAALCLLVACNREANSERERPLNDAASNEQDDDASARPGKPEPEAGRDGGREQLPTPSVPEPDDDDSAKDSGSPLSGDDAGSEQQPGPEPEPDPSTEPLVLEFQPLQVDPSVDFITDFVFVPGTNDVIVASKDGTVFHLRIAGDGTQMLGQFELPDVYDSRDCGLISLAFDPAFEDNGFLYAGYCINIQGSGVYRFHFDPKNYDAIADTVSEIVLVEGDPVSPSNERPWHNVGSLSFDADGALWVPFGDKVRFEVAQDNTNAMGALLRIVPNRDPDSGGYEPVPTNPFAGDAQNLGAIYAFGLRSPWHGLLDHLGRYWFGDVGSVEFEEINVVLSPAQNFGWPASEGPCSPKSSTRCESETDPLTHWDRELDHPYVLDDDKANPLLARVGYVGVEYVAGDNDRYAGRLHHRVIYGEYCVGWVRAIELNEQGEVVWDEHIGHIDNPSSWRQGKDGYLYVSTFGRCQTDATNATDGPSQLFRVQAAP